MLRSKDFYDSVALISADTYYTYQEIDKISNTIAQLIIKTKNVINRPIGLLSTRNADAILIILSILKSGNIYFPLSSEYSENQLISIIDNINPMIIFHDKTIEKSQYRALGSIQSPKFLSINATILAAKKNKVSDILPEISPEQTAYIIHTSGTTGSPKPIYIPHKCLVNLALWQNDTSVGNSQIVAQFHSFQFDVSLQEIFYALLNNKTLCIIPDKYKTDLKSLPKYLEKNKVNKLFLPTSLLSNFCYYWHKSPISRPSLNEIIAAGEQLCIDVHIERMYQSYSDAIALTNHYGPSETHVVTAYTTNPSDIVSGSIIPIGCPIDNTSIEIRNPRLNSMGELVISSNAIAESQSPYYSGDKVYVDDDKKLFFVERLDEQIKLSGQRVNLLEVKYVISELKTIKESYVINYKNRLHAFIALLSGSQEYSYTEIHDHLRSSLQSVIAPEIHFVETLPRVENGKVNARYLLEKLKQEENLNQEPGVTEQQKLKSIFSSILGVDAFDFNDNFFTLGGSSFTILQLIQQVSIAFSYDIHPSELTAQSSLNYILSLTKNNKNRACVDKPAKFLVPLKSDGEKNPIILIHPIGGTLYCFNEFINCFYDDRPVWGISDPALLNLSNDETLADLARTYARELMKILPKTKQFILCGASFGSIVAAEIACILEQQFDRTVGYLGFFDGWAMLPSHIRNNNVFELISKYEFVKHNHQLKNLGVNDAERYIALRSRRLEQMQQHTIRLPKECPIELYKAIHQEFPLPSNINLDHNGWETYSHQPIVVHKIAGDHDSMFTKPNIQGLINKLVKSLTNFGL